jgi:serine/threonine protein kinase
MARPKATQDVLDPRRLGKQNSGFTDEEIADIVCLLIPTSDTARRETRRIALESSNALIECHDESAEDDQALELLLRHSGQQDAIILRLSADFKNPAQGFTFGRNPNRCDICFTDDPHRRLSNVHFRIFLNEYGVLMVEDMSTNGTVVDETLLKAKTTKPLGLGTRRTLSSGTTLKIVMHEETSDLDFLVRIPRRTPDHERAYQNNVFLYAQRMAQHLQQLPMDAAKTIVPGPGGHLDLFGPAPVQQMNNMAQVVAVRSVQPSSDELLPVTWNTGGKYNRVGEIGKGAFATVYKLTSVYDGLPYAAKELDRRRFIKNGVMDQKVENEMIIMSRIKHDNIVEYVEHMNWQDRLLIIVMEYVPGGDLGQLIHDSGYLQQSDVKLIATQMLDALAYLHESNITHRDVKPDNILIKTRNPLLVKLTDFGLSKIVENDETFLRTFCGTLLYCAPEVYSEYGEYDEYGRRLGRQAIARNRKIHRRYDHAVDVWSLGGVLFYALSGSPPFQARNGTSPSELLHQIMTTRLNLVPLTQVNVSDEGVDFLTLMLERRPDKRASMKELLHHRWVGGDGLPGKTAPESDDEVSDGEEQVLQVRASQLSLEDKERLLSAGQCNPLAVLDDLDEDESFEDSQKENYTFGPHNPAGGRLFGEVDMNLSAIGRAGAVPANRLNLPMSHSRIGALDDMVPEVADSYDSETRSIPRPGSEEAPRNAGASPSLSASYAGQSRSVGQLNNATFDESSQDLGGAESALEDLNMKSLGGSHLRRYRDSELTTSKRRASSDRSDEREQFAPHDKPVIKRLKSETLLEPASEFDEAELQLFDRMPSISHLIASRSINMPVHKGAFWNMEVSSTWHLNYPEMMQVQYDAFKSACEAKGEEFRPGMSPLWDLGCKYFPPRRTGDETIDDLTTGSEEISGSPSLVRASSNVTVPAAYHDCDVIPATPPGGHESSLPDTLPPDVSFDEASPAPYPQHRRVVATLRSAPSSTVRGIDVSMDSVMLSWGRSSQNTHVWPNRNEDRIPKFALKIMLWGEALDPARNLCPWARKPTRFLDHSFAFYVSTKATYGIKVNGFTVNSYDSKNSDSPARNWCRLYDGDEIEIFQTRDFNYRIALTFNCNWSASSQGRPAGEPDSLFGTPSFVSPVLEPEMTACKIDSACIEAEKRLRSTDPKDRLMEEADYDVDLRLALVERERHMSQVFERKRAQAARLLKARAGRGHSSAARSGKRRVASNGGLKVTASSGMSNRGGVRLSR